MDRESLLNNLPTPEAFARMSDGRKQQEVEDFIRAALNSIDAEGREPDAWETQYIDAAIGVLAGGMARASMAYAARALLPLDQRAPVAALHDAGPAPILKGLRDALDYASLKPLRAY